VTAGEGRATARDQEVGGGRKRELDLEEGREVGRDAGDLRARAQSRGKGTNSQKYSMY
jgi:hypothetical protein